MPTPHAYTRDELAAAVTSAHSWRGVLRALGRSGASAGTLRAVRRQVDALGIDYSHFTGQRRWTDRQLIEAIGSSRTWLEVLQQLGLSDGGRNLRAIRTHAARLRLDSSRLDPRRAPSPSPVGRVGDPSYLRHAGAMLAAGWFMLRGHHVMWPLEPCRYDFTVAVEGGFQRVQVKTATFRNNGTYIAKISNARRRGHDVYNLDEIDCFFVIDAELDAYLIPFQDVMGYQQICLRHYREYLVASRGQWLRRPD